MYTCNSDCCNAHLILWCCDNYWKPWFDQSDLLNLQLTMYKHVRSVTHCVYFNCYFVIQWYSLLFVHWQPLQFIHSAIPTFLFKLQFQWTHPVHTEPAPSDYCTCSNTALQSMVFCTVCAAHPEYSSLSRCINVEESSWHTYQSDLGPHYSEGPHMCEQRRRVLLNCKWIGSQLSHSWHLIVKANALSTFSRDLDW